VAGSPSFLAPLRQVLAMENPTTSLSAPALISCKEVCRRTSLSRASLYRLMAQEAFPKPVKLHGVRKAWVDSEVDDWVAARITARNGEAA
jgi:prophage regulatory protein